MAGGYDVLKDIFPEIERGQTVPLARIGVDSRTGRVIAGWRHVEQSIYRLFATRYHERVMRYYVGSFVPHLIGQNTVMPVITRFWWAMATAIELWEPCYRVQRIGVARSLPDEDGDTDVLTTDTDIRQGHVSFEARGLYMPRGHLGDFTPAGQRTIAVAGAGNNLWRVRTVG